jgi:hypothetical protein
VEFRSACVEVAAQYQKEKSRAKTIRRRIEDNERDGVSPRRRWLGLARRMTNVLGAVPCGVDRKRHR